MILMVPSGEPKVKSFHKSIQDSWARGHAMDTVFQRCIDPACGASTSLDDTSFVCPRCGGLLDVAYDWNRLAPPRSLRDFEAKWADRANPLSFSGVWRFRELLPFAPPDRVMTIG